MDHSNSSHHFRILQRTVHDPRKVEMTFVTMFSFWHSVVTFDKRSGNLDGPEIQVALIPPLENVNFVFIVIKIKYF